jgi:chromosome partitioning protein
MADLVLVDTAGFGNLSANVAMTSADAVLVPALSGEADITEAEKTIRLVARLARAARRDIAARVLLNRAQVQDTCKKWSQGSRALKALF